MRILIIDIAKYFPGGDNYNEAFHIYDLLINNNYQVDLFKSIYYDKPRHIHSIDFKTMLNRRYNIIISMSPQNSSYILKYIKITKNNPKVIILDRYNFSQFFIKKPKLFDFKTKSIINKTKKLFPYLQTYFMDDKIGINELKKIYNINIEYLQPYINENNFIKDANLLLDDNKKAILFISRVNYKQNSLDLLIDAVKYITKTKFLEKNNLLIDVTRNGDDLDKFINNIKRKHIEEYFRFIPIMPYDKLPEYIREHRFSIIVPKEGDSDKIIINSMANGVPVLMDRKFNKYSDPYIRSFDRKTVMFSKVTSSLIKDKENGMLFESNNYIDLAEKIMLMISNDLTDMKRKAFETAIKFTPHKYDQIILLTIKEIIETKDKEIISEI
ncbi:MAG: glycosyltransferase [Candidatus Micrarchaeia archaeon]